MLDVYDNATNEELQKEVSCFGKLWDPSDPACNDDCGVQERCIRFMAGEVLPRVAKALGTTVEKADDQELLEHMEVTAPALEWLRVVHEMPELGVPKRDTNGKLVFPTTMKKTTHSKRNGALAPARPVFAKDPDESDEDEVEAEEPPPPKRKRGRPPKKKVEEPPNPSKARGALRQLKRARRGNADESLGMRASSAQKRAPKHWGPNTHAKRWMQERVRSRWIGKIPIGWTLRREWNGEIHEVVCRQGAWEYRGTRWPTLYSVVERITGAAEYPAQIRKGKRPAGKKRWMSNWSARRFFSLDRVLRARGLLPESKTKR